jgi:membrane protease YdiL (CAAX protease family)
MSEAESNASLRDAWALVFAMVFPTLMAWTYFVALAAPASAGRAAANPAIQAAYGVGKVIQFTFPLVYLGLYDRRSLRLARLQFRGLALGAGFGVLVAAAMLLLYHLTLADALIRMGTREQVRAKVEEFGAGAPGGFIALALFISVAHSLLEEYYWRWFVFGRLWRLLALGPAILFSSLAFMAHHVVVLYVYLPGHFFAAAVPFSLGVAAGGAVWAWLYARTGSIYAAWVSHLIVDAAIMAVGYDLLFGG